MNADKLVHMANQIAQFFASYPHEEAVAGVADHIQKFWERRMRQQLAAHIAAGGAGLRPLVIEAAARIASTGAAKSAG
ncbi:MAG: formate dehydrogenase subunit delta [Alphaproteobacteria bacterium]|nr:formate dehydrogenase subunit delta [Alphaproteobacteria bacterium]